MAAERFGSILDQFACEPLSRHAAAEEADAAAVRQLIAAHARDTADEQLLLEVLGLGQPARPARHRGGRDAADPILCGAAMHHERICGRRALHLGPHRSVTAMEAHSRRDAARRQNTGI